MATSSLNFRRPYLVIPKLIEQPTWGGELIVKTKGWEHITPINHMKIGQSYELFSGSNLSLLDSTSHGGFLAELTDRDDVARQTHPKDTVALIDLITNSSADTLGLPIVETRGANLNLLIKYTQALGNSFQTHIKDGVSHPKWLPKPESWYYFEPGLVTLGVKPGINWKAYEAACAAIHGGMSVLSRQVQSGKLTFDDAQPKIKALIQEHDPWQYVNLVPITKDQLVDLSAGGLHHSWEEDPAQAPHGNVLYELQAEALDAVSTFRNFDKGKMEPNGAIRSLQIAEYFDAIDRSPEANDPANHIQAAKPIRKTDDHSLSRMMTSRYYTLDKLTLNAEGAKFEDTLSRFIHLFVKSGQIAAATSEGQVTVGTSHSCFIPAAAREYTITSLSGASEILISY
jgi:hypothetical protein